ncbi:MAG: thioesterase family protein [Ilumatobacter sp.]
MSTAEFLGMSDYGGGQWTVPITERAVGGGRGSLFGGVGLAAGVAAMELETGQPAVWATAQYIATMYNPSEMQLGVARPAIGRTVTQCRVTGTFEGGDVVTVLGATGRRPEQLRGVWEKYPNPLAPGDSVDPERDFDYPSLHDHVEVKMARGMFGFSGVGEPSGDHRSLVWVRMPEVRVDAAALAIIADYSPSVIGNAAGRVTNLSSLDNTIRFADPAPADTDWVLCDNRVEFLGNGFAHSSCLMWTDQRKLLATASQSMTIVPV